MLKISKGGMKIFKKAILPLNFKASGIHCGIKKSQKLDLALFYSEIPAKAACQFTTNKIQAAPITLNREQLKKSKFFNAAIVNSGNANCFNGRLGLVDASETTRSLSEVLKVNKETILVGSTGIIGRRLPLSKIKKAIPGLVSGLSRVGIDKAKRAIMTTDTFPKEITVGLNIASRLVTICGVAKGAGMIAPDVATMLCFIFTDAQIKQDALNTALNACVRNTFNCISVDGCMSTNDSVILLANGTAKNALIDKHKHFNLFVRALNIVCLELAKMIVRDAEGATKFIYITVNKAKTFVEARKVALSIANSNLFKTAIYGENPNFGRVVASIGASGVEVEERDIKIKVSALDKREINVYVSIDRGNACATVYTSDLTPEYIKINAGYN